jgi:RNA polymerase I-specific transcription initiation factor RRN3
VTCDNSAQTESSEEAKIRIFQQILGIFEERVLSTHKSKFVQFLVMFIGSRDIRFAEAFSNRLLRIFVDETGAMIKRQSALMYLASFLARARFLSVDLVGNILSDIVTWCSAYLDSVEAETEAILDQQQRQQQMFGYARVDLDVDEYGRKVVRESAINRHESFYISVQAACYILCFHGTEMASMQRMNHILRNDWERVLTSSLNPLRYCLHTVRIEFFKLAGHVGMLREECWTNFAVDLLPTHLVRDAPSSSSASSSSSPRMAEVVQQRRQLTAANPLDSFFPFDPCLLRKMHHVIESQYRYWQGVPGMEGDVMDAASWTDDGPEEDEEYDDEGDGGHDGDDGDEDAYASSGSSSNESMASSLAHTYGTEMAISLGADASTIVIGEHLRSLDSRSAGGPGLRAGSTCESMGSADDDPFGAGGSGSGAGGGNLGALPIRRPRQYSVTSTGSW